tara:strand:- start:12144 stop:12305 length:162 start_codon:yes stop_codon:yes gene_type:complete
VTLNRLKHISDKIVSASLKEDCNIIRIYLLELLGVQISNYTDYTLVGCSITQR